MDLKYLRLVKTIVEEGNISNSADKLFLTQSALSHQLREMEERLGFKVFIRSRNNWNLTTEGQEIYSLAGEVLARIDQSLEKVGRIREGSKGTIRLSTECYTTYRGLPAFIQKMAILYPEIDIQLKVEATHHPISNLLSGDLDMCIVTQKPNNADLHVQELFEDELFALMHQENELSQRTYLEPRDFQSQHLIIHSFPQETVSVHQLFLQPAQVVPRKITAVPLKEVSIEMVEANMGVACFPTWALKSFSLPNTLKMIPLGENGTKRKHYLVVKKEDTDKQYVADFMDNMVEAAAFAE